MIGHLIAHAKAKLNLNTMQQGMFDTAVADSKAAREAGRALHEKVKATLQAELAKPEPDLAAVAAAADAAIDQGRAQRRAIRAEWLALYGTFTVEQKAVVKEMLQKQVARCRIVPREDARADAPHVRRQVRLTRVQRSEPGSVGLFFAVSAEPGFVHGLALARHDRQLRRPP